MAATDNKAAVRRFTEEVWNKGNMAVVDELCTPSYVGHDPATPGGVMRGIAGIKQFVTTYRTAFPDAHITIEEQIAEGDQVVSRWTGRGTNRGSLMGMSPTGKQVTVTGILISRFSGGKIVEEWNNWDTLGLMQQLGHVPTPEMARR